jgi:hypothetical protein
MILGKEAHMHAVLSRPGPRRWLLPVVPGILVALLFVALPDAPARMLVRDAGLNKDVRDETAALNTFRPGLLQARVADRDVVVEQSALAQEEAISGVRLPLDAMWNDNSPTREDLNAPPIETYARAFTAAPALQSGIAPEASSDAIASMLGQLRTQDEALLREPLLGMRLAEKALLADSGSWSARQLSHWAAIFATKVNEIAIPDGTRAKLERLVAVYQNDALAMNNARLQDRHDAEMPRAAAAGAVETGSAHTDRTLGTGPLGTRPLSTGQGRVNDAVNAARGHLWWMLGAVLVFMALIAGGGGFVFGRAVAVNRTLARS